MTVIDTKLSGVKVIIPKIWGDPRGYFFESYNQKNYSDAGISTSFVQDNEALSVYGVIRGLHFQHPPFAQAKLVRVVQGEVLDVVVDVRKSSPTFGQSLSLILNDINKKQLFVPEGFAHGYAVLSDEALFAYKCNAYYQPDHESGIKYDDPELNIDWIIPEKDRIISSKDQQLPLWKNVTLR